MTEDMIGLGRRAVACRAWRWMPGMATMHGERVVTIDDDGTLRLAAPWVGTTVGLTAVRSFYDSSGRCLPDLTDSSTLGCLLALVREAYRDTSKLWEGHVEVRRDHYTLFFVMGFHHDASGFLVEDILASGSTEVEALVCALEAAAAGASP